MNIMEIPDLNSILRALQSYNNDDISHYSDVLISSFGNVNPIFMKKDYASFFWDCASTVPGWMQSVIFENADAESVGSIKLTEIWKRTKFDEEIEDEILFHAKDEARHSKLFVKLLSYAFPGFYNNEYLEDITSSLNTISKKDLVKSAVSGTEFEILDDLIQMNLGEIRTLVHMHFLGPVIYSLTPNEHKNKVSAILQGLANDEIVHIGYTSKIINEWAKDGNKSRVTDIYNRRLHEFHKITIEQTSEIYANYSKGKYPNLLEI